MKIGHAKNRRGENQFDSDHAFRSKYNRACLQNQDLYGELYLAGRRLGGRSSASLKLVTEIDQSAPAS